MAITYQQTVKIPASSNGTTSSSVDTSGGNFITVAVTCASGSAVPTLSDNKSNTYTALTSRTATGAGSKLTLFHCENATCGTGHTFTLSGASSFCTGHVIVAAGVKTASALDVQNNGATTTGSITAGSVTPTESGELAIICATTLSPPTSISDSYTIVSEDANSGSGYAGGIAYKILSSTAATNPTWTTSNATDDKVAIIATFKEGTTSAPVLTTPTGTSITATGITAGFTTNTPSAGTCYFLRRVGGSAASAATIVSTGESQAAAANPQQRAMTGFAAGSTDNYVDMAHASGGNSNVVTYGPFTTLPSFAGTVPAKSGTNGSAFAWGSPSEASYFTGATSYSTTPALTLGLSINSGTGAITGTLSSVGSWTGVINGANSQGSVSSNSFTITSNAAVLRGFKFSSTAGLELGTIVGALTGLGLSADGEAWTAFAHDDTTHAVVATSGTLTVAGGAGRLPDWSHASIGAGTYFVSLRRNSDGATCSARLASEVI